MWINLLLQTFVYKKLLAKSIHLQHRCINLLLLFATLTGEQQGALLIKLFLLRKKRNKETFWSNCFCCSIFQIASETLQPFWMRWWLRCEWVRIEAVQILNPRLGHTISLSHSYNVSGTIFMVTCTIENAFINAWASLISKSAKARLLFPAAAGEKAGRTKGVSLLRCACLARWPHRMWYLILI